MKLKNKVEAKPPKPTKPCTICGSTDYYWPGDYYVGPKVWICVRCHPKPGEDKK